MFGKHSYFVIPLMVLLWVDSRSDLWTTWIELPNLVNGYSQPKEFSLMRSFRDDVEGGISDESYNEMISDLQTKFNEFKIDEDKRYFQRCIKRF
jgi:hypothetical protein